MKFISGGLAILIGAANIWIGYAGKTFSPWNERLKERYPTLYKLIYIIAGSLAVLIGIVIMVG